VKLFRSSIVGSGGFLGCVKQAEVDANPIVSNPGTPFFCGYVPGYSNKTASVVGSQSDIAQILCVSRFTKILSTIVERFSVAMLWFFPRFALEDFVRHIYVISTSVYFLIAFCVKTFCSFVPLCVPIELIQPIVIGGIHDRVLILRQSNKAVWFIKRLDDFVPTNTEFWHIPTSSGSVLLAAILL
jgi:hypothetical protein